MIPVQNLAETRTPDGSRFSLHEHDGEYFLKLNGLQLMSTTWTLSERLLADYSFPPDAGLAKKGKFRVLIGGMGLGYSLKRVLELVGPHAEVVVAELLPEVIEWNREFLGDINGKLMDDPRVTIFIGDVYESIRKSAEKKAKPFHAMLLDTDNGPSSLVQPQNGQMYDRDGLSAIWNALTPGGRVAFWAATREQGLEKPLSRGGFTTEWHSVKAHERAKQAIHRIYVGERPMENSAPAAPMGRKKRPRRR